MSGAAGAACFASFVGESVRVFMSVSVLFHSSKGAQFYFYFFNKKIGVFQQLAWMDVNFQLAWPILFVSCDVSYFAFTFCSDAVCPQAVSPLLGVTQRSFCCYVLVD